MVNLRFLFILFIFSSLFFFGISNSILATDIFSGRRSLPADWLEQRLAPSSQPSVAPDPSPTTQPSGQAFPFPSRSPVINPRLFLFPGLRPSPSPTPDPNQTKIDFMMAQINSWRQGKGLSLLSTDPYTCNFAAKRAREVAADFSHTGFNSSGIPYPSYSLIVENISMNSDYTKVVPAWIASSGHAANLSANIKYGCVGISADYYAFEGWRP